MLRNADGGGVVRFSGKKRYKGVMFHVISVTRGRVGVQFAEKWPLIPFSSDRQTGDCSPMSSGQSD